MLQANQTEQDKQNKEQDINNELNLMLYICWKREEENCNDVLFKNIMQTKP